MMQINLDQLMACTGARRDRAERSLDGINNAMGMYEINTPARIGMFLANVGHETMGLKYLAELGGDDYLSRYNGRADLGNVKPGDGPRFKGRGMLQTTGRANYAKLTQRLRARFPQAEIPDFEATPEMLERPEWAALSAADYVGMRNLNAKADAGDFLGYCIGINGRNKQTGLPNGWSDRTDLWAAAQKVL
jgi:putative chitinase